jgi:hypothetical protein
MLAHPLIRARSLSLQRPWLIDLGCAISVASDGQLPGAAPNRSGDLELQDGGFSERQYRG